MENTMMDQVASVSIMALAVIVLVVAFKWWPANPFNR